MRFDHRRLLACVAVAVLVACRAGSRGASTGDSGTTPARADTSPASSAASPRADSIALRTDKARYRAGEKMTLTFENRSSVSYAFNPCTRTIERENGTAWSAVAEEGRMCTMEAWVLDPHGSRTGPTELPSTLAAGRYRVAVRMTPDQAGGAPAVVAVSDPITVE